MMYDTPFHNTDLGKYSILVTGGAGFIGSHLVEYLIKYGAAKVRVLDNLATGHISNLEAFRSASNFEFIEGDITDMETCLSATQGMDLVLHQAALGSVPRSIKDPATTHAVNSGGFVNILLATRDAGIKRLVYASSSSVYGDSQELPKVEENLGMALSPYAVTKRYNELCAMVYAQAYKMELVGLRYFNIFGPRQDPSGPYAAVIPLFIQAAINKTAFQVFGNGEQTRDFTFVENAVQANIRALFSPRATEHPVYNVAVGDRFSILQLIDQIQELTGIQLPIDNLAPRPRDILDSMADISKATKTLEFASLIKLKQGLKSTLDHFQNLHTVS